jgi:hypothetical protein
MILDTIRLEPEEVKRERERERGMREVSHVLPDCLNKTTFLNYVFQTLIVSVNRSMTLVDRNKCDKPNEIRYLH